MRAPHQPGDWGDHFGWSHEWAEHSCTEQLPLKIAIAHSGGNRRKTVKESCRASVKESQLILELRVNQ